MNKFVSKAQISEALNKLAIHKSFFGSTFLVAKAYGMPVGQTTHMKLDALNKDFLSHYYTLDPRSRYSFRVFRFNNAKKFWNRPDYAGKGLQSINTRSLKEVFLHEKGTDIWGWHPKYVNVLSSILPRRMRVPLFHLSVWIYRTLSWPSECNREDIVNKFISEFNLTPEEIEELFALDLQSNLEENEAFQTTPVKWTDVASDYPRPPDIGPEKGGIITYLEMTGVGPVASLIFQPAERLNILTGDNGLGKTFLLEVAWWALTGKWAEMPAYPNRFRSSLVSAMIKFQISGETEGKPQSISYSTEQNKWPEPRNRQTISGLVVYARVDGSFAVYDPAKSSSESYQGQAGGILIFNREEVWEGKQGRIEGLIRDWTKWQDKPLKYTFEIFKKVLSRMSPPEMGPLAPGEPIRLPPDPREIPTIKHPYGEVPILHASAGVRRIVTLAYLIVWVWNEHKIVSEQFGRRLENKMVVLVDEVEAHLHPKWQRVILPALIGVSGDLSDELRLQLLVATHSPLVLASGEPVFDETTDKLFHLDITKSGKPTFNEMPFIRYGHVDSWLTSKIFDLREARSREAEDAIMAAIRLQKQAEPSVETIRQVSARLAEHLPPEDSFWPRWVFFAERYGVKL